MSDLKTAKADTLLKFWMPQACARLASVSFRQVIADANPHSVYPPVIVQALNEMAMAAALMMTNLVGNKNAFVALQISNSKAPIPLMVAECNADYQVRTMAQMTDDFMVQEDISLQSLINPNGQGQFVVHIMTQDNHQGIVPMQGKTISEMLQNHMSQSDQLDSRWLMASNTEYAQALFLQRVPVEGGIQGVTQAQADEAWETVCHKLSTMSAKEMLSIDQETLIKRLFWEDHLQLIDEKRIEWRCRCSRERFLSALLSLGSEQVFDAFDAQEDDKLEIGCHFCGKKQIFTHQELSEAFEEAEKEAQLDQMVPSNVRPS